MSKTLNTMALLLVDMRTELLMLNSHQMESHIIWKKIILTVKLGVIYMEELKDFIASYSMLSNYSINKPKNRESNLPISVRMAKKDFLEPYI